MTTRVGQYVSTSEGIGRVLYMTDYKSQPAGNGYIIPTSAVVIFANGDATKFALDLLQPSSEQEYQATLKPQIEPSEPETPIV